MAGGIPDLLNSAGNALNEISIVQSDLALSLGNQVFQWGIYNSDNTPAIIPDNIISIDYKKEYRISDYPIENGNFADYNKVALPFISRVRMSVGGSSLDRSNFLAALDAIVASTTLYNVVTPEHTYPNANVVDYDYNRTESSGAGMIIADLRLEEIRLTGQSSFSNTQSTTDQDPSNGGQLSPSAPVSNPPVPVSAAAVN